MYYYRGTCPWGATKHRERCLTDVRDPGRSSRSVCIKRLISAVTMWGIIWMLHSFITHASIFKCFKDGVLKQIHWVSEHIMDKLCKEGASTVKVCLASWSSISKSSRTGHLDKSPEKDSLSLPLYRTDTRCRVLSALKESGTKVTFRTI